MLTPINLQKWIDDHRDLLKPPVGNQVIWQEEDFIVMVVGGPNQRKDFHTGPAAEIFYQIEGDITLRVFQEGKIKEIPIKQGEMFFLPGGVPHSPQRGANTIGLVIEKKRANSDKDTFSWYCEKCHNKLYEETILLKDIVKQLPVVFDHFYGSEAHQTCKQCGHK